MHSKSKSHVILKIERAVYGDCYLGRHEGKVVMVKGAVIPGETAEVIVEREKKDFISASVARILDPAPDRTEAPCEYYGLCGGCSFQHVPHGLQVLLKEQILRESLRRLAKIDISLSDTLVSDDPWHYRLRAQFKVSADGIGLYMQGTRKIIHIDTCLLMNRTINDFIKRSDEVFRRYRIEELHLTSGDFLIARAVTSSNTFSEKDAEAVASALIAHGLAGLNVLRGGREYGFGTPYTKLDLSGLVYTVSPPSFLQSNWRLNQSVIDVIRNELALFKGKKVLDLYAGSGNFSLPLSLDAEVTAVEDNRSAVKDGKRNVKINRMKSCRFVRSSAESFRSHDTFDIIILDPPRQGLSAGAAKNVLSMTPETIIYISCDPATFSRDLRTLLERYRLVSVRMIDFFPQTFHIESIAVLQLK